MSQSTGARGRTIMIVVTTTAVVIVAAIAAAVGLSGSSDDDGTVASPSSGSSAEDETTGESSSGGETLAKSDGAGLLPKAMSGQAAIDALGDKLAVVAERNDMTVDELRDLLLRDATLHVTPSGSLVYEDTMTPPPAKQ